MKKQLQKEINDLVVQLSTAKKGFDTSKMKKAVGALYERLSVLEYLEEQLLGGVISEEKEEQTTERASLDSKSYRENNWFRDPEPVPKSEYQDEIVEPVIEKIKDLVAQMPEESQQVDELLDEVLPKKEYQKNDLEEFAASYQEMPVFERKEANGSAIQQEAVSEVTEIEPEVDVEIEVKEEEIVPEVPKTNDVERPKSVNDAVTKGLNIGLNDRLAFIKHLFEGKTEDYTRVLSQVSTLRTFDEADRFIKVKVKPDYNYWLHKDEYTKRFMKIIEKSFE